MKKQKRTKACDISHRVKKALFERDGGCIFCRIGYYSPPVPQFMFDAMHYIPRSKSGLGIEQNSAIGCRWHHEMMDQNVHSRRKEMLEYFKSYLMSHYPDWDEKDLVYDKWRNK